MEPTDEQPQATHADSGAGVVSVRHVEASATKQQIPYFVGVSGRTAGARGLSLSRVVIPPGGAAAPHIHLQFETAIYVISGTVETRYGEGLRESSVNGPGDFIYIAPGVPHQPRNLSATEPAVAIVARNDPDEQERAIPYQPPPEPADAE
jgi:uncharacterized RmlC-like cupin family protein